MTSALLCNVQSYKIFLHSYLDSCVSINKRVFVALRSLLIFRDLTTLEARIKGIRFLNVFH